MMRWTRRDFVTRTIGASVAVTAGGSLAAGCGGGGSNGNGAEVIEDPAAVKGGPKTTKNPDVIYPEGYVGPIASHKGPIVVKGENVELRIVVPRNSTIGDYAENAFTKWYEKRTGVHVTWQAVGSDEASGAESSDTMTKVNAMIASGDVPDAFMSIGFSPSQLYLNGQQGLFRPLESYIDDYGVEIKRVFRDYPDTRRLLTAPDGHIYSMPYVNDCYHCRSDSRVWMYRPWLDKLGLDVPETLDDFEQVLDAFVNGDPNGNGEADELPFMADRDTPFDSWIMGSFLYNPGEQWRVMNDGRIDVTYDKDGWREGLRYMNRLFRKGLLARESFTQDNETLKRYGDNEVPILGMVRASYPGTFMTLDDDDPNHRFRDYEAVPPLRGPDGTRYARWDYYNWLQSYHFVVTSQCRNPAVAVMWADGQYELEAQMRSYAGVRGENWRFAEEGERGINGKQALWTTLGQWGGTDMEGLWWDQNGPNYRSSDYRLGEVVDERAPSFELMLYENTKQAHFPHRQPRELQPPPLFMNEQQAAIASQLETSLGNEVKLSMANFVLGEKDIDDDAEWNAYLRKLDDIGLERYLEAYQEAYEQNTGGN